MRCASQQIVHVEGLGAFEVSRADWGRSTDGKEGVRACGAGQCSFLHLLQRCGPQLSAVLQRAITCTGPGRCKKCTH